MDTASLWTSPPSVRLCGQCGHLPPQDTASVSAGAANVFVPHTPRPPHTGQTTKAVFALFSKDISFKESAISFNSLTFMQSLYTCCTRIFFFEESANVVLREANTTLWKILR